MTRASLHAVPSAWNPSHSVAEHLHCFHFLAITDKAAVNVRVQASRWTLAFLGKCLRMFHFLGNCQTVCTTCYPHQQCVRVAWNVSLLQSPSISLWLYQTRLPPNQIPQLSVLFCILPHHCGTWSIICVNIYSVSVSLLDYISSVGTRFCLSHHQVPGLGTQ